MNLKLKLFLVLYSSAFLMTNCIANQDFIENIIQTEVVVQPIVEPVKPEEIAQVISESEKEILTESVAADQQQNTLEELMSLSDNQVFDINDVTPDELLADLEKFEAENPVQDISFEDKVKLALEYIKIKAVERKTCIIGTSLVGIAAIVVTYFAYKYYKNGAANSVV